ncbi:transcriptional regulator with XRE-family HTH domain [Saccharopolyspora lacisalsi]|uniref:Transcriptional regulator with XRE-family HTH domain n=1 Tax=Halosaccharopolyspora lacisalsi TaxID=1000566 RepID=A0A839DXN4_9PSEU|nr:helix-turn-helix transcriptional regulator [Halosaccharopolyspora lacisalsi]MBA8826254.1 transcriptional regulator with XRE-family HTH domain [Halosaccharopolyspora lacisalsi]
MPIGTDKIIYWCHLAQDLIRVIAVATQRVTILWHMVGTTPKARAVGVELRRAREDAGLSARQLAVKLGKSHTTIGRWESGERAPRPVDVAAVLGALGVDGDTREELVELARNTDGPHWIASGLPEQQRQLATLLEIERDATRIVDVSAALLPGMLQTSGYARAIIGAGGVPADEVEPRVAIRVGRRDALLRQNPTDLRAIIDESALHRMIGGPVVMVEQLRSLLADAELPNVELRVVPMGAGWHPALEGPFLLVEFTNQPPVIQVENRRSALFFHEPDDVGAYQQAVDTVIEATMTPTDSRELIARVINEMETT